MINSFSVEFFVGNRSRLRREVSAYPIVITANGLLQRNSDNTYPFRQDSNFYYLSGINDPDIILVMDSDSEFLIAPSRSHEREVFDGIPGAKKLTKISGISEILDETAGWQKLTSIITKTKSLSTLSPSTSYDKRHGFFANPAQAKLVNRLKRRQARVKILDLGSILASLRVVKQPQELKAIQQAIDITAEGIEFVRDPPNQYKYEYEMEADLTAHFRRNGANGHSFSPIVAGGRNACTLHNVANADAINRNNLITIDVGAEVDNYAADITRTIAVSKVNHRQKQVFDAVLSAQDFALGLLKPGLDIRDYEKQVALFLGAKLSELGLIRDSRDFSSIRKYCPHSTSHFLGLDVHDVGDYSQPLVANMVLTCEPGIYIPEEGIGVRIEDDVLITESGNMVLSRNLSRQLYSGPEH